MLNATDMSVVEAGIVQRHHSPGDYVLLKQEAKNTSEPPAYPHVLRILEIRSTGVTILEGSDAARCSRQLKDVAHCPLPILDTKPYLGR